MKKLLFLIVGVSIFLFDGKAQISLDKQTKIDALFSQWDNENSPGASIGIIKDGKLIYSKSYGMGNLDYQIPLTADSKFYIASTTKQFTAACIALLSIEGKIGLDDEIQKYIPEIPNYGQKITIRNLVFHTSGLRDYLGLMYLSGKSVEDYFTNDDGIKLISKQLALNSSPGKEFIYSNSGYILLAEIVNRASGMTIREYADKNIFHPLGMKNTFFNDDRSQITKNRVISYRKEAGTLKRFVQNFDGLGDGNLLTTVNDLYLWDQNFYHKKVGGDEFIDLISTPGVLVSTPEMLHKGDTVQYAFGLGHRKYKGLNVVAHSGAFLGFRTQLIRFQEQNFSVIVLSNISDFKPSEKVYRITDILLDDKILENKIEKITPEKSNSFKLTNKKLDDFSALYWNNRDDQLINIYLKNDTLRYSNNENRENLLLPISKNKFKLINSTTDITIKFELKDNKAYKMLAITDRDTPKESFAFEKIPVTGEYIRSFVGSYYSDELDCTYELKTNDDTLILYINGEEIITLNPLMDNFFTDDYYGTFRFKNDDHLEFILNSGRIRGIKFIKH